jgi:hypothetical protein
MRGLAKAIRDLCWLIAVLAVAAGCVSKGKANAEARAAYLAGQREEMQRQTQAQASGPAVTILGTVRNSTIPWTPDLTLIQALAAAQYYGAADPSAIIVVRAGRGTQYDPKRVLEGEDVPLQPQDMIVIR